MVYSCDDGWKKANIFIWINILHVYFLVVFSLGIGAFWELLEYSCDGIFHTNAQQYMASTKGTLVSKKDIPLKGQWSFKGYNERI